MRTLIIILALIAVLIAAGALFLAATTPRVSTPLDLPLTPAHVDLLGFVPPSAEAYALIPSAALIHGKLVANPVTREPILQWSAEQELPRPWILGDADVVAWRSGKTTAYAVRLDPVRALMVRLWLLLGSNVETRWHGSVVVMNAPDWTAPGRMSDDVLRLSAGLPAADALVVQRRGSRGAFPPIGRPAVTSVRVTPDEILLVSRAATTDLEQHPPVEPSFPRGAMLSAAFATPPRIMNDLGRLLGTRLDALLAQGGMVALYDVDTGTLLPRPKVVFSLPADDSGRAQFAEVARVAALVGETRDTGDRLLVSFDHQSMGWFLADPQDPASWAATRWALRLDPARLIPVLRKVGENPALRFVTPRVHRAARDLGRWVTALEAPGAIEASDSVSGGVEELRVRVVSK